MWSYVRAEVVLVQLMVTGGLCFVNLVYEQGHIGKAAMAAPPQNSAWEANKAIDGNPSQDYQSESCAITDVNGNRNTSIWWKVWLQKQFNVAYLEIYFRSDLYTRSAGFSIYTFTPEAFNPLQDPKTLVYHQDPKSGCPTSVMNVTVNNVTQGIVFINTRPPGYTSNCQHDNVMYTGIEICEIRVMGCEQNRFSHGCKHLCPDKCKNHHCDAFDGSCIHGCSDPNALTIDCIVCHYGTFISNKACTDCPGHCKDGAPCNKLTGMCDNGCANQWNGTFCKICPDHYYGSECNVPCGHCINNDVCDKMTGQCLNGCQNNWMGERCDECKDGFYNSSCTGVCGHCINGSPCQNETGYCTQCLNNFKYPFCKVCIEGYYGKMCESSCGHCVNGETCDKYNGTCYHGCVPNFQQPKCQVCQDGFYNGTCSAICGRCIRGEPCEKNTGICINGCRSNFKPPLCQVCEDGFYNATCSAACGRCIRGEPCEKNTGICINGCRSNFQPPLCQDCVSYKYGPNCAFDCGHCKNGRSCAVENGVCTEGCDSGWIGDLCVTAKLNAPELDKTKNQLTTTGVAIIASLSTMFTISLFVNLFMGRYIMKNKTNRHQTDVSVPKNKQPPQTYVDLSVMDDNHGYSSLGSTVPETPYNVIGDSRNNT